MKKEAASWGGSWGGDPHSSQGSAGDASVPAVPPPTCAGPCSDVPHGSCGYCLSPALLLGREKGGTPCSASKSWSGFYGQLGATLRAWVLAEGTVPAVLRPRASLQPAAERAARSCWCLANLVRVAALGCCPVLQIFCAWPANRNRGASCCRFLAAGSCSPVLLARAQPGPCRSLLAAAPRLLLASFPSLLAAAERGALVVSVPGTLDSQVLVWSPHFPERSPRCLLSPGPCRAVSHRPPRGSGAGIWHCRWS